MRVPMLWRLGFDRVVATDLDLTSVLPPGTTAIGLVRLCDDPACDGEGDSWFDPVTTLPAAQAPGAYAQLRVDLGSTDGVGSPLVDAVDASFTTVP